MTGGLPSEHFAATFLNWVIFLIGVGMSVAKAFQQCFYFWALKFRFNHLIFRCSHDYSLP
jgi:hypothetical protein